MHPLEFALGEYNHLLALHAVARLLPALGLPPLHAAAAAFFVIVGGILAASAASRLLAPASAARAVCALPSNPAADDESPASDPLVPSHSHSQSLNHTRFDIRAPLGLFRVAWHDIHHHQFAHK